MDKFEGLNSFVNPIEDFDLRGNYSFKVYSNIDCKIDLRVLSDNPGRFVNIESHYMQGMRSFDLDGVRQMEKFFKNIGNAMVKYGGKNNDV